MSSSINTPLPHFSSVHEIQQPYIKGQSTSFKDLYYTLKTHMPHANILRIISSTYLLTHIVTVIVLERVTNVLTYLLTYLQTCTVCTIFIIK